jgi:hypothetical protein
MPPLPCSRIATSSSSPLPAAAAKVLNIFLAIEYAFILVTIVGDHPHEHVYFNLPARMTWSPVTQNFDADYWGLSYRKGLETLLARDTARIIHVRVESDPGIFNVGILTPEQRSRISIHGDLHECDYWLAEFRGRLVAPEKVPAEKLGEIKNSAGPLLTIYKGLRSESPARIVFQQVLDFEDTSLFKNTTNEASVSGSFSNALSASAFISAPIQFTIDSILHNEIEEVQMQALIRPRLLHPAIVLVLTAMRKDSIVYQVSEPFQSLLSAAGEWKKIYWNVTFPEGVVISGDQVSCSVWSLDKSRVLVDDFKITVVKYKVANPDEHYIQ